MKARNSVFAVLSLALFVSSALPVPAQAQLKSSAFWAATPEEYAKQKLKNERVDSWKSMGTLGGVVIGGTLLAGKVIIPLLGPVSTRSAAEGATLIAMITGGIAGGVAGNLAGNVLGHLSSIGLHPTLAQVSDARQKMFADSVAYERARRSVSSGSGK